MYLFIKFLWYKNGKREYNLCSKYIKQKLTHKYTFIQHSGKSNLLTFNIVLPRHVCVGYMRKESLKGQSMDRFIYKKIKKKQNNMNNQIVGNFLHCKYARKSHLQK